MNKTPIIKITLDELAYYYAESRLSVEEVVLLQEGKQINKFGQTLELDK